MNKISKTWMLAIPLLLSACSSTNQEINNITTESSNFCIYKGKEYSTGAKKKSEQAISTAQGIEVIEDPEGIIMTCVKDEAGTHRWSVASN
mgnify:CR=1 FL=1